MKKNFLGLFIALVGALGVVAPVGALTCQPGTIRSGATVSSYAECNTDATQSAGTVWSVVGAGINTVMGIVGIVAAIMVIYGGIQYMTAAGDASKAAKAKNTIAYGVAGLVIVALAFAIVNFVIGAVLQ